jgi:gliding motility-associated-like protein
MVYVDFANYDFSIYNKWGEKIFETNNPAVGWDGTVGGKVAQEDAYMYLLIYTAGTGEYFEQKGTVTLIK